MVDACADESQRACARCSSVDGVVTPEAQLHLVRRYDDSQYYELAGPPPATSASHSFRLSAGKKGFMEQPHSIQWDISF